MLIASRNELSKRDLDALFKKLCIHVHAVKREVSVRTRPHTTRFLLIHIAHVLRYPAHACPFAHTRQLSHEIPDRDDRERAARLLRQQRHTQMVRRPYCHSLVHCTRTRVIPTKLSAMC